MVGDSAPNSSEPANRCLPKIRPPPERPQESLARLTHKMNARTESLDDLLSHAERYAEFSLRYHGSVPSTLLLLGPSGPGIYVPRHLDGDQAKDQFAATARQLALAHEATAVVTVLEAWAAHAAPGVPFGPTLPPSQAPNRQEVVALIGEAAGVQKAMFLPIQRHAAGGFSGFGPACVPACDHAEGRFAQILPAHPPTPAEKAQAQAKLHALGMRKELPAPSQTAAPRYWH
jgi:hypothetical protein